MSASFRPARYTTALISMSGALGVHGAIPARDGTRAFRRHAEAAQRVFEHAARQLALAHDHAPDPERFQFRELAVAVRARHDVDAGPELAGAFDDAPRLETVRRRDHQQARMRD